MPVVCKVIKNSDSATDELDFQNEISVLSHLRHPNLVLFLGACVDGEPKIIISEYLSGGSLEDCYETKGKEKGKSFRPPTYQIHMWSIELARALNFLHMCVPCILHRDLKPGNLLLTQEGHLKVSDFGLSKIIDKSTKGEYVMTGVTGTLRYMAPEVMRSEVYNEKVDIYSYGMVLWYMCTGERPLLGANQKTFLNAALHREHLRPDLRPIKYKPMADLMEDCWAGNADDRPAASEIVERLSQMQLPSNPKSKASGGRDKCTVS
uniref:Protein kinase domain-containing protein n=1 Tax=Hemiselmis tepida TaxID=464990 RepID=A0A7S0VJ15_9CRYP